MIVPLTLFRTMPERLACQGSIETGAPLVAQDNKSRYVQSVAKVIDAEGTLVGWVYLADSKQNGAAEYIQGNTHMPRSSMSALRLRFLPATGTTSISLLQTPLPKTVKVRPCFDVEVVH
jgi:hypothetical protein